MQQIMNEKLTCAVTLLAISTGRNKIPPAVACEPITWKD